MFLGVSIATWLTIGASLISVVAAHKTGILSTILGAPGKAPGVPANASPASPAVGPAVPAVVAGRPVLSHILSILAAVEPLLSAAAASSGSTPASTASGQDVLNILTQAGVIGSTAPTSSPATK
jgi:hypothetical protein